MTTSNTLPAGASAAEFLYADFAHEHASTRRVLERYPDGKGAWRPHDKSRTLGELATHVASIVHLGLIVLEQDELDGAKRTPPPPLDSAAELLAKFDDGAARLTTALAGATFESLERPWTLRRGDQVFLRAPRRTLLRTFTMSHLVHHRGQLTVYYRLLGIPVPGPYGPSADDVMRA